MRTYSSVKEVLESGLFDQQQQQRHSTNQSNESSPIRSNISGRQRASAISSSASRSASFTTGVEPGRRRLSEADTRISSFNSSFASIDENAATTSFTQCERVCLSSSPPAEEIDLAEMTSDEFNSLKKKDPFMYHSIPEIHKRSYKFEEGAIDLQQLLEPPEDDEEEGADAGAGTGATAAGPRGGRSRFSASCPAGLLADADIARAQFEQQHKVIKRRRLSAEAHPTLVCEDMLMGEILNGGGGDQGREEGATARTEEERLLEALMSTSLGLHDDDSDGSDDEDELLGY